MTENLVEQSQSFTGVCLLDDVAESKPLTQDTFECRVLLCPEEDGGYSAHALRLLGVVSQGETKEEALENIREAFRGAILAYRESGQTIPWGEFEIDRPKDSIERWILVNV